MTRILDQIEEIRRRCFGRYELVDPRPTARVAPYTFFLPPEEEVAALRPGDLAKLIFTSCPPSATYEAERMWVEVTDLGAGGFVGDLVNTPFDMPQLEIGATIPFEPHHVIAIEWRDAAAAPRGARRREYWERCVVDACVLSGEAPVFYLYREAAELGGPDDAFPDSGWRIRGDFRGLTADEIDARELAYVALGKVLNVDDSWLELIDAEIGAAFERDADTGAFRPL